MKRSRTLSKAAGFIFLLYGILRISLFFITLPYIESFNPINYILWWLPPLVFFIVGLLLLIDKHYVGIIVATGVYFAIYFFKSFTFSNARVSDYIPIIGSLLLFIASIIALNKKSVLSQILSIISGICYLIYFVSRNVYSYWMGRASFIENISHFFYFSFHHIKPFMVLVCDAILLPVAIILFGIWTCSNEKDNTQPVVKSTAQVKVNSEDAADRILALKKLLDAGIITQDEFDRKKSEIL